MNTHRGLFRYERLPFGVKSAPSIFQKFMDQLINGIKGAFTYLDDLIIASSTIEEHLEIITKVFDRIKRVGLKLQLEKCKFIQKEFIQISGKYSS